jgi:hypothetical protein
MCFSLRGFEHGDILNIGQCWLMALGCKWQLHLVLDFFLSLMMWQAECLLLCSGTILVIASQKHHQAGAPSSSANSPVANWLNSF